MSTATAPAHQVAILHFLTWQFTSIDPQTLDLPADPDLGFLPPNVMAPDGEGFVEFSIRPLPGLATGTRLDDRDFVAADAHLLRMWLGAGSDVAIVLPSVTLPAIMDGGGGHDLIYGGSGASVLLGGSGDDLLVGGSGRNVIIGSAGSDVLWGGASTDMLIAGSTSYDDNDDALLAILAEWSSLRTYAERVANLRDATGPMVGPPGIKLKRGETVFDDNGVDALLGGTGLDWFLLDPARDRAWDKLSSESAN